MQVRSRLKLYTKFFHYAYVLNPLNLFMHRKIDSLTLLEHKLKQITNSKYVIPVTQARVGLYLSIKYLLKNSNKNEVLMSPYTVAEVVSMVVCAGGTPKFCDIDSKTCNISPKSIKKNISSKTGLILITHFYGNTCDIDEITKIAKNSNLPLVEDAAQAYGAKYNNLPCGTFGDAGVYSFGLYKNINAFYGGAILTNNLNLFLTINKELDGWSNISSIYFYKKVINGILVDIVTSRIFFNLLFFRLFRWAFKNKIDTINNKLKIDTNPKLFDKLPNVYKAKLTNKQAFLVLRQLDKSVIDTDERIKNAELWNKYLTPVSSKIILPPMKKDKSHIYWYYPIQFSNRSDLVEFVQSNGHDISESYHRNCANLECYKSFFSNCKNAENTAKNLIYLPCYPGYPKKNIIKISNIINKFFQ